MIVLKTFDELTKKELYEILKIRVNVFMIEQQCFYSELDDIDYRATHVFMQEENEIKAYLRFFKINESTYQIGRVLSCQRKRGYATKLLKTTIDHLGPSIIYLEAQTYTKDLYKKLGFKEISSPYLEDGIEHVKMERSL